MQTQNDGNTKNTLIKINFFRGGGSIGKFLKLKQTFWMVAKSFFLWRGSMRKINCWEKGWVISYMGWGRGSVKIKLGEFSYFWDRASFFEGVGLSYSHQLLPFQETHCLCQGSFRGGSLPISCICSKRLLFVS